MVLILQTITVDHLEFLAPSLIIEFIYSLNIITWGNVEKTFVLKLKEIFVMITIKLCADFKAFRISYSSEQSRDAVWACWGDSCPHLPPSLIFFLY